MHPDNADLPFPLILSGPAGSVDYFRQIDDFIAETLGPQARALYRIVIGDPARVAREIKAGLESEIF